MKEERLRAWWAHRQGLDGGLIGATPATILERTGWARSVGGSSPYLTLYARGKTSREAVDAAAARQEIHELPSARGCTHVLAASDFALGLKAGQPFREPEMNTARKLGVTDKEIEKLCAAIVKALAKGALDPEEIRAGAGGAVRNLGEEGKKKGMITTLPVTLGKLQAEGAIRRVPVNGRLDQQRYKYALWSPNPLAKFKLSYEEACTELARRYFSWIGPATLAEFQWFSGLGVKASKAAVEPLKLAPLEPGSDQLMHAADLDALNSFREPKKPHYVLVSCLDGISLLRRDVKSLVAPEDLDRVVPVDKGTKPLNGLADFPAHAILDRGRLAGLWEFDTGTGTIAWMPLGRKDPAMEKAVREEEAFVREQLGDARSFSLDSPKSREPKIQALRAAV